MNAPAPNDSAMSPVSRLVATLRGRHWSSFLLELALITIGILLALYIDARIQERQDRDAERASLAVLSRDLDQMRASLKDYREFEAQKAAVARRLLQVLREGPVDVSDFDFRADLWTLSSRRTMRLISAAYTDMISTGNVRLIEDRALREQLLQFFAEVSRVERVLEKNNTVFIDELYLTQLFDTGIAWAPDTGLEINPELRQATGQYAAAMGEDLELALTPVPATPLDDATRSTLRQLVITRARVSAVGRVLSGGLDEQAQALKAAVDAERSPRSPLAAGHE